MSTWLESSDGRVVAAPASMQWSVGKRIAVPLAWANDKHFHVYVADHDAGQIIKLEQLP